MITDKKSLAYNFFTLPQWGENKVVIVAEKDLLRGYTAVRKVVSVTTRPLTKKEKLKYDVT